MGNYSPGRVQEVFSAALELPPAERDPYVQHACGDEPALLQEVRELLGVYADVYQNGFPTEPPDALIGSHLGPYYIRQVLDSGGMGQVYLANRSDGAFDREVAVKVIKPGVDDADVAIRFDEECRILASLHHPYVAALFDAGRLPDGRLYFVMEYVDGHPLTDYCDRRALGVGERVRLFRQVCDAVAFAHRNLIIHRDLKPGNILVDADGQPKLLDFGIAKVLTRAGREWGVATHPLLKRATPGYASAQQLQGDAANTGMDVFALGVILHELLTGRLPQPAADVETTMTDHGAYQAPSALGTAAPAAGPPGWPHGALDADLDAIVLRAIDPNQSVRYSSVEALARELDAWREMRPVDARRGGRVYRLRKFLRRHPLPVAAGVTVAVAVVVAAVSLAVLWRTARRERATAVARFDAARALAGSLSSVDQALARVPGATVPRHLLAQQLSDYLARLEPAAASDPALRLELAESHRRLAGVLGNPNEPNIGDRPGALRHYDEAAAMLRRLRTAGATAQIDAALARTLEGRGDVLLAQAQSADAAAAYDAARQLVEPLATADAGSPLYPQLLAELSRARGDADLAGGDAARAQASYENAMALERAAEARQGATPERKRAMALTHLRLAETRATQGAWSDARAEYDQAIAALRTGSRDGSGQLSDDRDAAIGLVRLAALTRATEADKAEQQLAQGTDMLRRLAAADPGDARVRRDLVAALVQHADAIRSADFERSRGMYKEARTLAETLRAEPGRDPQTDRDLAVIDERLAAAPSAAAPELTLFAVTAAGRRALTPGDPLPPDATRLALNARAPAGWTRYVLAFGAEGAATIFDEPALTRASWSLPIAGPPPAQTVILLALPTPLSPAERDRVAREISAIPGPRIVDWDSQVVWTSSAEPTIVSTASSRGARNTEWITRVRTALAQLHRVQFAGRTIPIDAAR